MGAVAVQLSAELAEPVAQRVRAGLEKLSRAMGAELPQWEDEHKCVMLVRNVSVRVASIAWDLARRVRDQHVMDDRDLRVGVFAASDRGAIEVEAFARTLVPLALPGSIALGRNLMRALPRLSWSEVESDLELDYVLHFPASGRGISEAASVPVELRRYVASGADDYTDREGFLDLSRYGSVRAVDELTREPRALILGTPWIGKTWIATQLKQQLQRRSEFVWMVSFEKPGGVPTIRHDEWATWKRSGRDGYVILDALDEGIDRGDSLERELSMLLALGADVARMHVLAFSRPTHRPETVKMLGWPESDLTSITWHLQPLDQEEAERSLEGLWPLADESRFERVRKHLRVFNDKGLASDFGVLRCLADAPGDLDREALEDRVLDQLCKPKRVGQLNESDDDRRRAASRLAAISLFSGAETVALHYGDWLPRMSDGSPIELPDAFPAGNAQLERAARSLVATSLFEWVDEAGYRFRQRFAKERLAARELASAKMVVIRRLVAGPRGGVNLAHRQVLQRLISTLGSKRPELARLEREVSRPLSEKESLELLEKIVEACAGGTRIWNLRNEDNLSALAHPAVAGRVVQVIRDANQSLSRRQLALDIAVVNSDRTGWQSLPNDLVGVALDESSSSALRLAIAEFVCRADRAPEIRERLDVLLERHATTSDELRAVILTDQLERGAMALDIAQAAPEPEASHFDARALLFYAVERRLSDTDARLIVDEALGRRDESLPRHALDALQQGAFEHWLTQPWDESDIARIATIVGGHRSVPVRLDLIEARVRDDETLRHRMFLELATQGLATGFVDLDASDAAWLAEEVEQGSDPPQELLVRAYLLAQQRSAEDSVRVRIETILRARHGTLFATLEENAQRAREREALRKAQTNTRSDLRPIYAVVDEIFDAELDDLAKVQNFGLALFRGDWRPSNIYGTFDDLGPARQNKVLDYLVQAFGRTNPTSVPTSVSRSYPTVIALEAAAFSATALQRHSWLSSSTVVKWLRSVLFARAGNCADVVSTAFCSAPAETRAVLLEALGREARGESFSNVVREFPHAALRDDRRLVAEMLDIAARDDVTLGAARDIVWTLAARLGKSLVGPLAARREWPSDRALVVRMTEVLLREGASLTESLPEPTSSDRMWIEPLLEHFGRRWTVNLTRWGSEALGQLAEWLVHAFPPSEDVPRPNGTMMQPVTAQMDYQDLRQRVVQLLLAREDVAARAVCARLNASQPSLATWLDRVASAREIDRLLAGPGVDSRRLSPREVAEQLDTNFANSLRGADDLFHAVMELFDELASDVGEGTDLVWVPRSDGASTSPDQPERRLAAYVRTRLKDRLAGRFGSSLKLFVEVTEAHRDRPDVIGVALATSGQQVDADVAIEFKWSHATPLYSDFDKLAQRYLLEKGRSHGIYVVGFSGRKRTNRVALEDKLRQHRELLEARYPSIRLGVVVLPFLRSHAVSETTRSRKRPAAGRTSRKRGSTAKSTSRKLPKKAPRAKPIAQRRQPAKVKSRSRV